MRVEPLTNPVAFGVGGAAALEFHEAGTREAICQEPEEFDGGTVLCIKYLENHRTTGLQCVQTGQCLSDEKTLHGILLPVEIRAEVEPAVGGV